MCAERTHNMNHRAEPNQFPCPACGAAAQPWRLAAGVACDTPLLCPACGLGVNPLPDTAATGYTQKTSFYTRDPLAGFKLSMLRRAVPAGKVFDVGCNWGDFLVAARGAGYQPFGLEFDPTAAAHAANEFQLPIVNGCFHRDAPDEIFDAVTFWHSLEHFADAPGSLDWCRAHLAPGGRVIIAVPNLESLQARLFGRNWYHLNLPDHQWHFTLRALTAMLEKYGFAVESVTHLVPSHNVAGWRFSFSAAVFGSLEFRRLPLAKKIISPAYIAYQAVRFAGAPIFNLAALAESAARNGGTFAVTARLADGA